MDNNITLSIVIVDAGNRDLTIKCIDSIFRNPPINKFEIILVDTSSQSSCIPEVNATFPSVKTVRALSNLGFAQSYNQGMRLGKGRILMSINNDTFVHPGTFDFLIRALDEHPNYGLVGPCLRGSNGRIQIACCRGISSFWEYLLSLTILDAGLPLGCWLMERQSRLLENRVSGPTECISGAAIAARSDTIDNIGLFDENYHFYFEDIEWCWRTATHGFQVAYISEAQITHLGDSTASTKRAWAKKNEYLGAQRFFMETQHIGLPGMYLLWLSTIYCFVIRSILYEIKYLFKKNKNDYAPLIKWILTHPPKKQGI